MQTIRNHILVIIILLSGHACQNVSEPVTVIENVRGYTLYEGALVQFTEMAIREGKVVEIAVDDTLKADRSDARVVDGRGRVMLPGFIDAHAHVMGLGFQELDANLTGLGSLDESLRRVEEYAADYPELDWIRGRGWNHTHWPSNRFPTAADLDRAVNDRPVWLRRIDGHAGWANSVAMERAGITADTEDPPGGKIVRGEDGNPTGIFVDRAMNLIEEQIPERTAEEEQLALANALKQMRAHGLTGVQDAGIDAGEWELYTSFADRGDLTTRIYAMIGGTGRTFDALSEGGPVESYAGDLLALRSVKLYADGALGSRGAALLEEYTDDPGNRGLLFYTESEMADMIFKTASRG
ncbi:MAG: amidohydrolase family protein, partial [Balneolaceae bacterium]|nr:amidohydrolase family protein [Balneolaceae bacterium]